LKSAAWASSAFPSAISAALTGVITQRSGRHRPFRRRCWQLLGASQGGRVNGINRYVLRSAAAWASSAFPSATSAALSVIRSGHESSALAMASGCYRGRQRSR
jgi:hypothetical protein